MKPMNILLSFTLLLTTGCMNQEQANHSSVNDTSTPDIIEDFTNEEHIFSAYIHEINGNQLLVTPIKTASEANSASLISISVDHISDNTKPALGDTYEITYDGIILETYPAQLNTIHKMTRINRASKTNDSYTHAVMIQGIIYYDTGLISEQETRNCAICGTIDSLIDSTELPRINNQSNFLDNLPYQCYFERDQVEILIDDEWHIFEKEDGPNNTIKKLSESSTYKLYPIDINALETVFTNYSWNEGTGDCLSDYELMIDNIHYVYHSDCGTLNDNTNQRNIQVSEQDKNYINDLLNQCTSIRHWSSGPMKKASE